MVVWSIVQVFKDQQLLCRVRKELADISFCGILDEENTERLLRIPLLQSIYSELLRLRVEVQTIFFSDKEDIHINEWRIPKGSIVVVPAGKAHTDPDFWNTRSGQFPLDQFWADRFLTYPDDPQSGPRKPTHSSDKYIDIAHEKSSGDKAKFVNRGLADSYMPYGIGERTCPGRGFARRAIITLCALVVDRYDIEFTPKSLDLKPTTAFYGIGTQRVKGKIPFRIRQRPRAA